MKILKVKMLKIQYFNKKKLIQIYFLYVLVPIFNLKKYVCKYIILKNVSLNTYKYIEFTICNGYMAIVFTIRVTRVNSEVFSNNQKELNRQSKLIQPVTHERFI